MTTAYFIGTSLTAGWNGVSNTTAYPMAMAARIGWTATIDGWGGSGYTVVGQAGVGQGTFIQRIAPLIAVAPSVVVVEGGANDGPDSPTLEAAAALFLSSVRATLPNTLLYVTGSHQIYSDFEAWLISYVPSVGGQYVSWRLPVPWLNGTGDTTHLMGNGNRDVYCQSWPHLTTVGYQYVGTRFAFAIKPPSTGLDY